MEKARKGKKESWVEDTEVRCPFYRKETDTKISCDGVQEEHILHSVFQRKADQREYKATFCRGDWEDCPLSRMQLHR